MAAVCQSRSLQREHIFAVKLPVPAQLAWSSTLPWVLSVLHPFLHCRYRSEPFCPGKSLESPEGLQIPESRNKSHPETHPASSRLLRPRPQQSQYMLSYLWPPRDLEEAGACAPVFHYSLAFADCCCEFTETFSIWIQLNEVVKLDFLCLCLTGWKEEGSKRYVQRKEECLFIYLGCIFKHSLTGPQCCRDQTLKERKAHQSMRLWRKCNFSSSKRYSCILGTEPEIIDSVPQVWQSAGVSAIWSIVVHRLATASTEICRARFKSCTWYLNWFWSWAPRGCLCSQCGQAAAQGCSALRCAGPPAALLSAQLLTLIHQQSRW